MRSLLVVCLFAATSAWGQKHTSPTETTTESDCNQPAPTPLTNVELPGHPLSVVSTRDGCWLFVSLTSDDPKSNGVAVLRRTAGTISLQRVYPIERRVRDPLYPGPAGMVMTHDGQLLIAANNDDLVFLSVQSMISAKAEPVVGHLDDGAPKRTLLALNGFTKHSAGTCCVNISKDDGHLFVSNELAGTISVVDLAKARRSNYDSAAVIGQIPVSVGPQVALTFSPDERWLYTTNGLASDSWNWPSVCPSFNRQGTRIPEGAVVVVDVQRAISDPGNAVVSKAPAGCVPIRLAITHNGESVWVLATNSNAVIGFDTAKLLSDPLHARIGTVTVGTQPRGMTVLPDDKHIVVANSQKYTDDQNSPSNVFVIDIDKLRAGKPAVIGTFPAGAFPREFSLSPDERTLFLANYLSNTIEVIDVKRLFDIVQTPDKAAGQQDRKP